MKRTYGNSKTISSTTNISWIILKHISRSSNGLLSSQCYSPPRITFVSVQKSPAFLKFVVVIMNNSFRRSVPIRKSNCKVNLYALVTLRSNVLCDHEHSHYLWVIYHFYVLVFSFLFLVFFIYFILIPSSANFNFLQKLIVTTIF